MSRPARARHVERVRQSDVEKPRFRSHKRFYNSRVRSKSGLKWAWRSASHFFGVQPSRSHPLLVRPDAALALTARTGGHGLPLGVAFGLALLGQHRRLRWDGGDQPPLGGVVPDALGGEALVGADTRELREHEADTVEQRRARRLQSRSRETDADSSEGHPAGPRPATRHGFEEAFRLWSEERAVAIS